MCECVCVWLCVCVCICVCERLTIDTVAAAAVAGPGQPPWQQVRPSSPERRHATSGRRARLDRRRAVAITGRTHGPAGYFAPILLRGFRRDLRLFFFVSDFSPPKVESHDSVFYAKFCFALFSV